MVNMFRRDGAICAVLYSHFRPPTAQRRQIGFASSHFTRRALQVLHPVRTLDVLSRVLFGTRSNPWVMVKGATTQGRLGEQRIAGKS
jgi:hypothetical protein